MKYQEEAAEIIKLKREITNVLNGKQTDHVMKALAFTVAEVVIGSVKTEIDALQATGDILQGALNKIQLYYETVGFGVPEGQTVQ